MTSATGWPALENKALTVKAFLRLFFFEALRFCKKKVVKASKTLTENHHFRQILGEKLLFFRIYSTILV